MYNFFKTKKECVVILYAIFFHLEKKIRLHFKDMDNFNNINIWIGFRRKFRFRYLRKISNKDRIAMRQCRVWHITSEWSHFPIVNKTILHLLRFQGELECRLVAIRPSLHTKHTRLIIVKNNWECDLHAHLENWIRTTGWHTHVSQGYL